MDTMITDIEVHGFRCTFTVSGFKRLNLISGEDDIGKSNLLDACLVKSDGIRLEFTNSELIKNFKAVQDNESELNAYINDFDAKIEGFKIIGDKPNFKVNGDYQPLEIQGSGLRRYISIICAIYACKDSCLFIDNIEQSIHYQNIERLSEIILKLSKKNNCQIFATTLSSDVLESFAGCLKEDDEFSYTRLVKNKDQETKAIIMDVESFINSVDMGLSLR